MEDNLSCFLEGIKGKWSLSFDDDGSGIYREEYDSSDFPVAVVLEKGEWFWVAEVYRKDSKGWERSRSKKYSGLDAYRQAYDFFSEFARDLNRDRGLGDRERVDWG